jgi:hypothetical protein
MPVLKKSLHNSDRVYRINPDNESNARALSFGVAGVSFASLLAIAALEEPEDWLIWATCCFAGSLPLSLFQAFLSLFVSSGGWSTWGTRTLSVVAGHTSHLSVCAGVCFIFLHISSIAAVIAVSLGGFFWVFAVFYARVYGTTCAALSRREKEHPELPDIQPPLDQDLE